STSRAEWLPGLNPAATNTLVSSTTSPGPVVITAVWTPGGSRRKTPGDRHGIAILRGARAGPRSHRRANAAGPAHAGSPSDCSTPLSHVPHKEARRLTILREAVINRA